MASIGAKVIRALFIGLVIGLVGGLGIYYQVVAVNIIAGYVMIPAEAILMLVIGASLSAAVGIELSGDLAELDAILKNLRKKKVILVKDDEDEETTEVPPV